MHEARARETQRLAGQALETSTQGEMLTLDFLHRQLFHRVLFRRQMSSIDARLVGVIPGDAQGREQGAEFQEHRILPGANDVGEHSSCAMIDRMPQPPCLLFGTNKTPHLIELRGAPRLDAGAGTRRGEQGGVGLLQRGGFFLIQR